MHSTNMEHRGFPHNKNEEVQNNCLSYFLNLHPYHVVALVNFSVEAIQHVLPLNILLIDEFQAMIAAHVLLYADVRNHYSTGFQIHKVQLELLEHQGTRV